MNVSSRFSFITRAAPAVAAGVLALAMAAEAHAAACSTLPNPVYVAGSSAAKPFLAAVAKELAGLSSPITLIYQGQGSCTGVNYLTASPTGTITGTASIWGTSGTEDMCDLSTTGDKVDIGLSDVYPASCGGASLPSGVKDFFGPVQTMTFIVPGGASGGSSQTIISAEAAYLVYGFGNNSEVSPWTDETLIEQRNDQSGTQQMISAAIKVPAAKWKGHTNAKSGDLITSLAASKAAGNADKAIGILATDGADKNRDSLKVLGYQHYGQDCAYWPDSTAESFDKANVRDGHYAVWGPLHMLAHTANGTVDNASAKTVIDYLSGATVPTDVDLIKVEAKGGVVPDCAMRVKRTTEVGPLVSYMPDKSCECKFVAEATGSAPSSCKTCTEATKAADCPKSAPACNFGYCEVK
jgi:ABC-type phosphate transport system substrate-binding protein